MPKLDTFKNDVRKEQIALLRFEKQLVAMAETLAAGAETAKSTDEKLSTKEASRAYAKMKVALQKLANETQDAHDSLMNRAVKSGGRFLEFGDVPGADATLAKGRISNTIKSALSADATLAKGRVSNNVKSALSADATLAKGRVADDVKSNLTADATLAKGRVADDVKSNLTADATLAKGRVASKVKSSLSTS